MVFLWAFAGLWMGAFVANAAAETMAKSALIVADISSIAMQDLLLFRVTRHPSQRLFAPAPFPRRTHGSGDKPLRPAVASPGQSRLIQHAEKCHGMGLLMRILVPIPHGIALPNEWCFGASFARRNHQGSCSEQVYGCTWNKAAKTPHSIRIGCSKNVTHWNLIGHGCIWNAWWFLW